jgi:HK97 family phage major capsid protein
MPTTLELRQKRANLIKQARDLHERAERENRSLTAEERQQFDRLLQEADEIRQTYEREERLAALEADLNRSMGTIAGGRDNPGTDPQPEQRGRSGADETRKAVGKFYRGGLFALTEEERRALNATQDDLGHYIVAPQQVVTDLLKNVDDLLFIRRYATIYQVPNADSLGRPSLDQDLDDFEWTTELKTGSEDNSMRFGKRELRAHPMAKRIKISNKLLRLATQDPEALVRQRLAYKLGVTQEKAYLTGDGVDKPLGVFVASKDGISTARDVSDGNTNAAVKFDGLIRAKYKLKQQYWARARWLFHRDVAAQIATEKDNNGQYIWRESVRVGEPDRLLGFPVDLSEFAPNTMTSGQYVGLLADWSGYAILDSLAMQVQRLVELYAEQNQIGIIARYEGDGMPMLEEAFVRVKLD